MSEFVGGTIRLLTGMEIKLSIPFDDTTGMGVFVKQGTIKFKGTERTLLRGFLVENEEVGTIEVTDKELAEITYKHRKAEKNSIWFFSHNDRVAVCNIVATPIHDHSSIVQGGPAYGTYFSDDEVT